MLPSIEFRFAGPSRSFPEGATAASAESGAQKVLVVAGDGACLPSDHGAYAAVLIELGNECLAARIAGSPANVFGFSRFRLGEAAPTDLVELVRGEDADPAALDLARRALEGAGLQVSVCADRVGRIVNRLIRPQFNLAFAALDDGLATRDAIESCLRNGLGYRKGLMDAVEAGGLADHHAVCNTLFEAFGTPQFAPARKAIVAHQRQGIDR